MNDFLNNLRNGKDKRFERPKRQYENPQYPSYDRRRKRPQNAKGDNQAPFINEALAEAIPDLKRLLVDISDSQRRLADAGERRAVAEEKKAEAFAEIALYLKQFVGFAEAAEEEETASPMTTGVSGRESADLLDKSGRGEALRDRDSIISVIKGMHGKGATYQEIAEYLEAEGIPTFSGRGRWHAQTVHRLCRS